MADSPVVFNHVGLVVRDLAQSRRFYEELLGFAYWWEFEVPDELASPVLRVPAPMQMTAVYLVLAYWRKVTDGTFGPKKLNGQIEVKAFAGIFRAVGAVECKQTPCGGVPVRRLVTREVVMSRRK